MSIEGKFVQGRAVPPDGTAAGHVRGLLATLDAAGVRYCHWKSNIRLPESLDGKEDLDLLVHREDASAFLSALAGHGFKLARSRGGLVHPGVFHAFALRPDGSGLLHVHAYFGVVTGDSLVKCYRFPFGDALISGARWLRGVPVPAAEAELVLFALRIALKHTSPVEVAMVSRGYGEIIRELEWLRAQADDAAARALWAEWVGGDPRLFGALLDAIGDRGAVVRRIYLGWRISARLAGWRRIGTLASTVSRFRRSASLLAGRFRRRRDLVPETGGMIIALVGPKASGKSTLGKAISRRIGRDLDVRLVHVGKPPATVLTFLPRLLLPLARRMMPGERSGAYEKPERRERKRYSLLYVLRMVMLAHERRRLLGRCWRDAAAGAIIVADRYPSASIGAIDGAQFDDEAVAQCRSPLKRWLMRYERALYARLPSPGLVLRLVAPVETTVRRDAERIKQDAPDAEAVRRRRSIETETEFRGVREVLIDTDQPLERSIRAVVNAVWARI